MNKAEKDQPTEHERELSLYSEKIPPVSSIQEFANICRISKRNAYEIAIRGDIECVRIGRRRLITAKAICDFLESHTV